MSNLDSLLNQFHTLVSERENIIEKLHSLEENGRNMESSNLDEDVKKGFRRTHLDSFIEINKRLIATIAEMEDILLELKKEYEGENN